MAKGHFKLRDRGTSYYDSMQQKGIVGDRVEELDITDHVRKAQREGRIIKVDDENEIASAQQTQAAYDAKIAKVADKSTAASIKEAGSVKQPKAAEAPKEEKPPVELTPEQIQAKEQEAEAQKIKEARAQLEVSYKEATGLDPVPGATDSDLEDAITTAIADKKNKATSLKDLDNE